MNAVEKLKIIAGLYNVASFFPFVNFTTRIVVDTRPGLSHVFQVNNACVTHLDSVFVFLAVGVEIERPDILEIVMMTKGDVTVPAL